MIDPMTIKVGDTFYFVCNGRHARDGAVTVESVGRKWVKLTRGYRFDRTDPVDWRWLDYNGGTNSPGELFDSKEHWAEHQQKTKILAKIQGLTWYGKTQRVKIADMKLEDIKTAARILGCEV